ncbi:RNA-directed DNA polymerase from mobile element jockey, partial [Acropora cervicornis]
RKINACKLPPRTIECRNYAKYNSSAFCDDLRDIPWDVVLKERNVNTAWSNWKELFLNVCDRHAPYKRKIVRGVKCPWLTGETKRLMNQRDSFLRKARRSGAEVDWNAYRRLRNQVSNKIKNKKRHYHRNEIQENLNSPKAFWKAIKKVFPSKKGNSACPKSIKTEEGYTITDKSIIAEKFNNFFTNAVSKLLETVHQPIWLHHNKLVLNMKKTEFMTFGTRQRLVRQKCDETDISLNGQSIKHTDTFKYLGVVLDDTLSFNDHVDYVRMKVSKILGMFSRIRPSLTMEAANRLYKAMVLPVLDYCDAVWHECGQGNSDKIERLQRRAARIIYYKAVSNLSTDQIMTKLGLEPLYYRRRTHILRFVDECIANRVPRYLSNDF